MGGDAGETWESMYFPHYPGGRCHPNHIVLGHTKKAWDAGSSVGVPETGREEAEAWDRTGLAWWAVRGLVPRRKWPLWEDWRYVGSF